jgi:DNA replication protein DnaC
MTFHPRTRELLFAMGLAPRELKALGVTPIHPLPDAPQGFGLVGTAGVGKTWALVHKVACLVDETVRQQPDPSLAKMQYLRGDVLVDRRISWVNWHDQAETLKRQALESQAVESWVGRAQDAWLLVMDDMGSERVRGVDDFSRALLAEVLDHRYRQERPVLWTSNLGVDELATFYRGRLASRLLSAWPPYEVEGEDLRLAQLGGMVDFKKAAGGDS